MKKYVLGILSGFACGLIASMLWVIVYVYIGFISSLCALPIAKGIEWGYKKSKANVDNKTPYIVASLTMMIVLLVCFIIIPVFLIYKEGYAVTGYNLSILYKNPEFMGALIKDSLVSVLFAFLGVWGVFKQLKLEANPELYQEQIKLQEEYNSIITKFFIKNNALGKENGVSQDQVNMFLKENPELHRNWLILNQRGFIKKYKKTFYYPKLKNTKS